MSDICEDDEDGIGLLCDDCIGLVENKLRPEQIIFDYPPEYYGFCDECMEEINLIRMVIGW